MADDVVASAVVAAAATATEVVAAHRIVPKESAAPAGRVRVNSIGSYLYLSLTWSLLIPQAVDMNTRFASGGEVTVFLPISHLRETSSCPCAWPEIPPKIQLREIQ